MNYKILVEIELGRPDSNPELFGFATNHQYVDPGDGGTLRTFKAALRDVVLPGESADFLTGTISPSTPGSMVLSREDFPAFAMTEEGHIVQTSRIRIWWWKPGTTLNRAILIWSGQIGPPTIDFSTNSVTFNIAPTTAISRTFPPGALADQNRFPDLPKSTGNRARTVVYGAISGLPVYALEPDDVAGDISIFVAGHSVSASDVLLYNTDDGGTLLGALTPVIAWDGLGEPFTKLIVDTSIPLWSPGTPLFIGDRDSPAIDAFAYGYPSEFDSSSSPGVIDGLGDVLLHMVMTYGGVSADDLDMGRINTARVYLNRFRVAMYFNSPSQTQLISYFTSRFTRQFPVAFSYAGGRFGWDYTGLPESGMHVAEICFNQNSFGRGPVSLTDSKLIRSRFRVSYKSTGYDGTTLSGETIDETSSAICRGSFDRWGVTDTQDILAPDLADQQSAFLLAEDQAIRLSKQRYRTTYELDDPSWMRLPLLSRVLVTDSVLGWESKPFFIEGKTPRGDGRVTLSLISEDGI